MKKVLSILYAVLVGVGAAFAIVLFFKEHTLTSVQLDTLKILSIICLVSILYCFIAGEISRNNSQMDKLWSILPIIYAWVIAVKGGFSLRLIIIALLITVWGSRLTINFAKKGAYSIKFWSGEEDYRWIYLRSQKGFSNKIVWAIFDLLFISLYQNVLVLLICIPALLSMEGKAFNVIDIVAIILTITFFVLELVADRQQMAFHTKKHDLLNEGKKLEELPHPYNKGFNTIGLWNHSRHPNYLGEQGIWCSIYLFSVASTGLIYNYSILGCLLLLLVFYGSSSLAEGISMTKYPEYKEYVNKTSKYFPWKGYNK